MSSKITNVSIDANDPAVPARHEMLEKQGGVRAKSSGRSLSRKSIDQRAQIIHAAFECFSALGYDNASTRMIAKKSGASHTKILYHFGSKENLWISTMDKGIGDYVDKINNVIKSVENKNPEDALREFIEKFVIFSAEFPAIHRIMSMERAQATPRLDWLIQHYLREVFNVVCGIIRRAQAEGAVRDGDPVRLYYLIINAAAAPFTLSGEYNELTGRDVFSETEISQSIEFIYSVIFV